MKDEGENRMDGTAAGGEEEGGRKDVDDLHSAWVVKESLRRRISFLENIYFGHYDENKDNMITADELSEGIRVSTPAHKVCEDNGNNIYRKREKKETTRSGGFLYLPTSLLTLSADIDSPMPSTVYTDDFTHKLLSLSLPPSLFLSLCLYLPLSFFFSLSPSLSLSLSLSLPLSFSLSLPLSLSLSQFYKKVKSITLCHPSKI